MGVTLVSKEDATIEDMQLFYFCRNKNPTKCTGLEAPCTCSRPPCVCPDDRPVTTSATSTSQATTTTTTTTIASSRTCALSACGCDLSGQSWCNNQNGCLQDSWCQRQEDNCSTCNGVWCASDSNTRRLLSKTEMFDVYKTQAKQVRLAHVLSLNKCSKCFTLCFLYHHATSAACMIRTLLFFFFCF